MTISTLLILGATHAIAFVGGALLCRNNSTKIDAAVTAVSAAEKAAQTAASAVKKL